MIADHEAQGRFDAISQMSAEIATLNTEIDGLKHARDAARLRAERAEMVVRQLESQIASPKREAITIYSKMKLETDRVKHDAALAKLFSEGWTFVCDGTVLVADPIERYTTLVRTAPIEPATDLTDRVGQPITTAATPPVPTPVYPGDPATFPPAHPFIGGLWNALYAMDRFAELVNNWPRLAEYAPRVHAVFTAASCDMTDVVIMKSFRFGHRDDTWTLKVIFPVSTQIAPGTRTALAAAGVRDLVRRDGREFIFDLPAAWVGEMPRKTVKADAVIVTGGNTAPDDAVAHDRANLNAMVTDTEITHQAFHKALINSRLPHDEQDELLMQSRQVRVGGRIAAQTARIPSYQPRPINSFLTGGK
jgi:hypothetical protein